MIMWLRCKIHATRPHDACKLCASAREHNQRQADALIKAGRTPEQVRELMGSEEPWK